MNKKEINGCCPDCGSTNISHYSWCKIHETPFSVYVNRQKEIKEVWDKHIKRKDEKQNQRCKGCDFEKTGCDGCAINESVAKKKPVNGEGKVQVKEKNICELCKKEIPNAVIFNTNALTIAQYFTDLEYRKDMGKEWKWCVDCTHKEREKK